MGSAIELVQRGVGADGSFDVRVGYPDEGVEYGVSVTDPASPGDEELLGWYFERHLEYPFLNSDRRRAAVEVLRHYGEALFGQVFGGAAGFRYQVMRSHGFDECRIEVVGGAGLHRLHWEALFDPELDTPLAMRVPITRRLELRPSRFEVAGPWPTLNILVITARPDGATDVGYRTISRPLVDAVHQASLPVTVDVVRPGTWEGLRAHLEAARADHGGLSGWYHLVHFDVHGAFADHAAMAAGARAGRYLFAAGDPAGFAGRQGFLFFETATVGRADPRPAVEVANLLAEYRVPVAVLNACQSAMQTDSEAALAQQLVQAGVPVVVGMAYSVTVTAAALAMPVLYEQLCRGADTEQAVRVMRRRLFDVPERQGYFDQTLPLQDWVLPVSFRQRGVSLELRAMDPGELEVFEERQAEVGDEPSPEYGFVGRDLDVQAIERMLLIDSARTQLLVRGMAGAGKSTLLAHVGWWWRRTGLIGEVFSFSFEERAWTVDQMVRAIAGTLWPDRVEFAVWESLSEKAKRERVARALREQRHLLLIDNAESITAAPAAIPHALPDAERDALRAWMGRLRAGRTLVIWGSREAETWVAAHSFADNTYQLRGLDPQAASVLADRILTRHRAIAYRSDPSQRTALHELLKLLGGYPLPMEVVLPNLATTPPATVLAELKTGGIGADPAGLIRTVIEYSHGKLNPTIQHSLALLAPFTAVIPGDDILAAYQQLLTEPADDPWGSIDLAAAVAAAIDIGLATPHDTLPGWVHTVPILPYFLRQALREHPRWWQAARQAHYLLHASVGSQLGEMLTGTDPELRTTARTLAHASYANLTTAVDTALEHGHPVLPVLTPVEELLDQSRQHTAREDLLRHALTVLTASTDPTVRRELPVLLHLAGMSAQEQRRFEQAEEHYKQALDLELEFGDRHSAARTYHQLGIAAQLQRRFEQAEEHYKQALDLKLEFGDRHSAARTYHQLGRVAEEQRRFEQAEEHYKQALDLELEFGDRHSAASTYHQLGIVAHLQRRFEQAEEHYRQSLELELEFGNRHGAAITCHQLGAVAHLQRQYEQAEDRYQQALESFLELGDRHGAAFSYHQLGRVAEEQSRFEQAGDYYQQALDLKLEFGDHHGAASTYHQLGAVAQLQRQYEQAEGHYQQAIESFLEFDDRHGAASTYHQLGMVAQEQRRFEQAEDYYRQAREAFRDTNDERSVSQVTTTLGRFLADVGRHSEAFTVLIDAAVSWWRLTGAFDPNDIRLLAHERNQLDEETVGTLIGALDSATATALRQRFDQPDET